MQTDSGFAWGAVGGVALIMFAVLCWVKVGWLAGRFLQDARARLLGTTLTTGQTRMALRLVFTLWAFVGVAWIVAALG